jgi:hypothetical protein
LDASNHASLKTIRFFSRIARLAVSATMASAIATSPWQRGRRCWYLPSLSLA